MHILHINVQKLCLTDLTVSRYFHYSILFINRNLYTVWPDIEKRFDPEVYGLFIYI